MDLIVVLMAMVSRSSARMRVGRRSESPEQLVLEVADGLQVGVLAPNLLDDLDRRAERREGLHLEDAHVLDVVDAFVRELVEQGFEHGPGSIAVLGEVVPLAHVVGALLARERGLVEGHVADEIEGGEVLADLAGELLEEDAVLLELLEDRLLAVASDPGLQERVEAREPLADGLARVVPQRLGDELAVLAVVLDPLGDDETRGRRGPRTSRRGRRP
jgi:hypothetical protein